MQDSNESMGEGTSGAGTNANFTSASRTGEDVKRQIKDKAHEVAEQAQSAVEGGKARIAERAQGVAEALHHASDGLRAEDREEVARYTEKVAEKIEQFSGFLRDRDLVAMASDVKRFAQRQPALFLGGAFTAGLMAARFIKSSAGEAKRGPNDDTLRSGRDAGRAGVGQASREYAAGVSSAEQGAE
jgi:hypothetical protein